ncbi:MAG: hypothetical protein KAS72_11350 [Phycisphaerales bacterium]|nr:hypothetical protein [Phycisphaerales bacterium]
MSDSLRTRVLVLLAVAAAVAVGPTRADDAPTPTPTPAATNAATEDDPHGGYPEALVVLRDGRRIEGGLAYQDDNEVTLIVAGIEIHLNRATIRRVELLPSLMERYEALRAQLADGDHEGILRLAEWLRVRGALEEALEEAGRVVEADPDNYRARQLFYIIGGQIALKAAAGQGAEQDDYRLTRRELLKLLPDNRISDDDVNLLRVYEVDLNDPPRIIISREVRERLIEQYTGDPLIPTTRVARAVFMRTSDADVLAMIFKLGAKEYYGDVKVLSHPESLRRFRDDVHQPWLRKSCATTRCHGGLDAGRFFLHTREYRSDRTVYSNFLTIERLLTTDGEPLLDYENPSRSVLFQYGLPRDLAIHDHPDVQGWRPVFRSEEDRKFLKSVAWVESLYKPRPNHAIEYDPPSLESVDIEQDEDADR